jgi:hypothetical protein
MGGMSTAFGLKNLFLSGALETALLLLKKDKLLNPPSDILESDLISAALEAYAILALEALDSARCAFFKYSVFFMSSSRSSSQFFIFLKASSFTSLNFL